MTDQELADAIRARFADHIRPTMALGQYTHLGRIVRDFCDEHPAWAPSPGGRAYWKSQEHDVWTVGPNPNDPREWVVMYDNEDTRIAHQANLEPARGRA